MAGKPAALRGVIDSLEEGWALIALDDKQRLDWPRDRLPGNVEVGTAVALTLEAAAEAEPQAGTWQGIAGIPTRDRQPRLPVRLGDQELYWSATQGFAAGDMVVVRMQKDLEDTERRRQEVQNLVDDLFG